MKICLINPGKKRKYQHSSQPTLGLAYLGAGLLEQGNDVQIIDADSGNLSISETMSRVKSFQPEVVGLCIYSPTVNESYDIFQAIKELRLPDVYFVLGGPHATAMPDRALDEFDGCDYLLRGEADISFLKLIEAFNGDIELDNVLGLSYRLNGKKIHNSPALVAEDLDSLPFPARHLLEEYYNSGKYYYVMKKGKLDILITSRGCPFNCKFCYKSSEKYRARSPENVMEEIVTIVQRGIRNIHFMDDQLTLDKKRAHKLFDMIIHEKMNLSIKLRSRVDTIDEDLLRKMKRAGVFAVVYGMESGCQRMLDLMDKKTTVEMNKNACRLTKQVGIQCFSDWFFGFPGETLESIEETTRFIMKIKPDAIQVADTFYPFPGTEPYTNAKENGTLVNDWSIHSGIPWIKMSWMKNEDDLKKTYCVA